MHESALMLRGRIVDGTGSSPIEDGTLVIRDGRIAEVGGPPGDSPAGALLDARDMTLLPGLVDSHVHLLMFTEAEQACGLEAETVAASTLRAAQNAEQAVMSGVTTLRDCGARHAGIFELRRLIDAGLLLGPRLVLSGSAIAATGGHAPTVSVQADGEDGVRAAARAQVAAGADFLKVMATGGTATPNERIEDVQFTRRELEAIVDEGHRRGKAVTAHCSCLAGAQLALSAGVDSIEHGIDLDDETCAAMAERGVPLVSTLAYTQLEAESDPSSTGVAEFAHRKAIVAADRQKASFRRAVAAGVPIALGTDADGFGLHFGTSMVSELAAAAAAGMSNLAAIRAATLGGAKLLGRSNELGTLRPGRHADVLLVDGRPDEDIAALRNVQLVLRGGKVAYISSGLLSKWPQALPLRGIGRLGQLGDSRSTTPNAGGVG